MDILDDERLQPEAGCANRDVRERLDPAAHARHPVSYTHLTLPTSDLGEISVVAVSLKKKTSKKQKTRRAVRTKRNTERT